MTGPITRDELVALIRYHRDSLSSHRWQMAPSAATLLENTIKALTHYRDLLDVIDAREPEPDPFTPEPSLPPLETTAQQEKPA